MHWEKFNDLEKLSMRLQEALGKNSSYNIDSIMGFPGSNLDENIFPEKIPDNSAYWRLLWENPNHIGCHTYMDGEAAFKGTQEIEMELLRICAEQLLKSEKNEWDGYVSTGGTESNIQALWTFRNKYIIDEYVEDPENINANDLQKYFIKYVNEINVVYSEDTHYSVYKAAHILNIPQKCIPVNKETRQINVDYLSGYIDKAKDSGVNYFIIVLNMGTTMFGSVDNIDPINELLASKNIRYTIHVDAAFGGFIYPFTNKSNKLTFENNKINSFTLDAHKMLQAPYGTGIYLVRKHLDDNRLIKYVTTGKASYIEGNDSTVCGSRSGANAVSIWMILKLYGPDGGLKFCEELLQRTKFLCDELEKLDIEFFRDKFMNIVAIRASASLQKLQEKHHLVPNSHDNPEWYKVVVMNHVDNQMINEFINDLKNIIGK
jgi:glutamate/tyrosine decarboxylase-like PLP-dependent enzyme